METLGYICGILIYWLPMLVRALFFCFVIAPLIVLRCAWRSLRTGIVEDPMRHIPRFKAPSSEEALN